MNTIARKKRATKKRKCSNCGRAGHNKSNCPRGRERRTPPAQKITKGRKKYPAYFYENAPSWVINLNNAKINISPKTVGNEKRYCGNCSHLKQDRGFAGEPFCARNNAAVRGQWYCSKWKKGSISKIKLKVEGLDV